jgi:arylsulfatase regulator (Fe-S oxidoreductase)
MGKEIIHDKGVSSSYKLSFYNIRFILEGKEYLWNTLTGACICLDRKGSEYLKDFKGEEDNTQYFEILQKNGCITDSNINEFEKIIYEEKYILNNEFPNRLSFTIAPGLGCNYKCVYCFEDGNLNNKYMSEEVVEKNYFVHFVKN